MSKLEEIEHNISNRVRDSELSRKQQEQQARRLSSKLAEMKRQHQMLIKQQMIDCANKERDLEQKLLRQQSELAKVCIYFLCVDSRTTMSQTATSWTTNF